MSIKYSMLSVSILFVLMIACHSSTQVAKSESQTLKKPENQKTKEAFSGWYNAPRTTSSQVRVISRLNSIQLESKVMEVLSIWQIDIDEHDADHILTMPFDMEKRTMRLLIRFDKGEAVVSGEYSGSSLNPAVHNWKTVTPQIDFYWERVHVLASVLDHEKLLYN